MFYTVYKITNVVNGKYYVGKHQTTNLNDGYMGSGKRIKLAIAKYGIENFHKEYIAIFDNEEDMNEAEREFVVLSESSYNLCEGGKGGFSYINNTGILKFKGKKHTEESKKKMGHPENSSFKGRTHSDETKRKIGESSAKRLLGIAKSEEHKKRISEAIKKKWIEKKAGKVFMDTHESSKLE